MEEVKIMLFYMVGVKESWWYLSLISNFAILYSI